MSILEFITSSKKVTLTPFYLFESRHGCNFYEKKRRSKNFQVFRLFLCLWSKPHFTYKIFRFSILIRCQVTNSIGFPLSLLVESNNKAESTSNLQLTTTVTKINKHDWKQSLPWVRSDVVVDFNVAIWRNLQNYQFSSQSNLRYHVLSSTRLERSVSTLWVAS